MGKQYIYQIANLNKKHALLQRTRRELATALSRAGGAERSPPGSLQTWEQRARMLTKNSAVLEGQLGFLKIQHRLLNADRREQHHLPHAELLSRAECV